MARSRVGRNESDEMVKNGGFLGIPRRGPVIIHHPGQVRKTPTPKGIRGEKMFARGYPQNRRGGAPVGGCLRDKVRFFAERGAVGFFHTKRGRGNEIHHSC